MVNLFFPFLHASYPQNLGFPILVAGIYEDAPIANKVNFCPLEILCFHFEAFPLFLHFFPILYLLNHLFTHSKCILNAYKISGTVLGTGNTQETDVLLSPWSLWSSGKPDRRIQDAMRIYSKGEGHPVQICEILLRRILIHSGLCLGVGKNGTPGWFSG